MRLAPAERSHRQAERVRRRSLAAVTALAMAMQGNIADQQVNVAGAVAMGNEGQRQRPPADET